MHEAFAAAMLERKGYHAEVFDGQTQRLTPQEFVEKIRKINPEIIVCRISAPSIDNDFEIIANIKNELDNIFIIGWGSLCKIAPQEVISKSKLDLIVGEAELEFVIIPIIEKIQEVNNNKNKVKLDTKNRYIDFLDKPFIKDLNELPPPAFHLLDMEKYVTAESSFIPSGSSRKVISFSSVLGSHGCSFNCMYCVYPKIFGKWRGRSPEKIVDDVETLVNRYNVKSIWFEDQTFIFDVDRSIKICDELIRINLNFALACETRADKIPVMLLKKMKKSGCTRVQLGVETGDPVLFSKLGKSGCTLEEISENIMAIKREGMIVEANFIVGLPGESWESIRNTANFINKFSPDIFSVSLATPYPETKLYEIAEKNKWIITKDWKKYGLSKPVMSLPTFSANDMEKAREYLLNSTSLKRQWKLVSNDLKKGRFGKVIREAVVNAPQATIRLYKIAEGKKRTWQKELPREQ
jgi:radical SAM superfamily enzyme YgiQ (UPF0313 family)